MSGALVFDKVMASILIVAFAFSSALIVAPSGGSRACVDLVPVSRNFSSTGTIIFHVVDASNNAPIEGATIIMVDNPDVNMTTGSLGYATFQYLSGGFRTFRIHASGYENQTVEVQMAPDEAARHVDIMLWPVGTRPASALAGFLELGIFLLATSLVLFVVWVVRRRRDLGKGSSNQNQGIAMK